MKKRLFSIVIAFAVGVWMGGTWLLSIGEGGSYWAATCNEAGQAYALLFIDGMVNARAECTYDKDRGYSRSVRLVQDCDTRAYASSTTR